MKASDVRNVHFRPLWSLCEPVGHLLESRGRRVHVETVAGACVASIAVLTWRMLGTLMVPPPTLVICTLKEKASSRTLPAGPTVEVEALPAKLFQVLLESGLRRRQASRLLTIGQELLQAADLAPITAARSARSGQDTLHGCSSSQQELHRTYSCHTTCCQAVGGRAITEHPLSPGFAMLRRAREKTDGQHM